MYKTKTRANKKYNNRNENNNLFHNPQSLRERQKMADKVNMITLIRYTSFEK